MPVLKKINGTDYEGAAGAEVTIVAVSQNNNGVEQAFYEYDGQTPDAATFQGHPGCKFVLKTGRKMFETLVVFAPGFPNARYDLFEVDAGGLVDLQKGRTASDPNGRIGMRITGLVPALAGAPPPPAKAAAKKATAQKAPAKKAPQKAAKKPAKKAAKKATKAFHPKPKKSAKPGKS